MITCNFILGFVNVFLEKKTFTKKMFTKMIFRMVQ